MLETPSLPLPPTDPVGWVQSRKYIQQNFSEILNKFLAERSESIKWLQSLKAPDWSNAFIHHEYGPLTARMFLTNWVAHDYLHFRQIVKLKFDYLEFTSGESTLYAGSW